MLLLHPQLCDALPNELRRHAINSFGKKHTAKHNNDRLIKNLKMIEYSFLRCYYSF